MRTNRTIFRSEPVELYSPESSIDGAINAGKDTAECVYSHLMSLGDHDTVLLDLGANVGATGILLARAFPRLRVVAYEPQPRLCDALRANVELHHLLSRVECVSRAVGDYQFVDALTDYNNTGMSKTRSAAGVDSIPIQSDSLDRVFLSRRIDRCDILKMDIEGAEYSVLSRFTLWDRIGKMHLETHAPLVPLDELKQLGMYDHHFGPETGLQRYVIDKFGCSYQTRHLRLW